MNHAKFTSPLDSIIGPARCGVLPEDAVARVAGVRRGGQLSAGQLSRRCVACLLFVATLAGLTGCAGYQIGQQQLYRPDIRTVHVPVFESASFRRNLGEQLAEAVATEIMEKTPYRVVSADRADSILRGRLISETKRVIAEDRFDNPRVIEAGMVAQIDWVGSQGELLSHTITIPIDQYELRVGAAEQFIPEAGQSVATAHQRAIQELAQQIVAQMEVAPW